MNRYMIEHYMLFTEFYDRKYRMMLMKQYSGRQRAYEEAVKYFIGGSRKYGNATDWDTRNDRLLDRMTSLGWSLRKRQLNRKNPHRVGNGNSGKVCNLKPKGNKDNRWKREDPSDTIVNQRVVIAYGDAKMAWNMPGTLPMSHQKIKHYMALASKRLGRFTADDGVDASLIGQLKFQVVDIPEYMTSQVFC